MSDASDFVGKDAGDFVGKLKAWVVNAGGRWPEQIDETLIYGELLRLTVRQGRIGVRVAILIRSCGGRLQMTHDEIAVEIGTTRESVTRFLSRSPEIARAPTGLLSPRWAYGFASDPPEDLRCDRCRLERIAICPACRTERRRLERGRSLERRLSRMSSTFAPRASVAALRRHRERTCELASSI